MMLKNSYHGYAQMTNLLQSWLLVAGDDEDGVRRHMQNFVKQSIKDSFDVDKASLFFDKYKGGKRTWVTELIQYPEWRQLIYELSEEHPSSVLLNYIIQLIADAGHQQEIANISSIANNLGIFSTVFTDFVKAAMSNPEEYDANVAKVAAMASASQHTFLYCQLLLHSITEGPDVPVMLRLSQVRLSCTH